jgi:hypothetical protein
MRLDNGQADDPSSQDRDYMGLYYRWYYVRLTGLTLTS